MAVWINAAMEDIVRNEPHRRIVTITHRAPTMFGTVYSQYDGPSTNSAFATELSGEPCWTPGIIVKYRTFGLTH